jgi:hypothetical protein
MRDVCLLLLDSPCSGISWPPTSVAYRPLGNFPWRDFNYSIGSRVLQLDFEPPQERKRQRLGVNPRHDTLQCSSAAPPQRESWNCDKWIAEKRLPTLTREANMQHLLPEATALPPIKLIIMRLPAARKTMQRARLFHCLTAEI